MKSTGHSYRSLKMKSTYAEVGGALVTLERVDDAEVGLKVKQFLQVGVGVKQLGGAWLPGATGSSGQPPRQTPSRRKLKQ